MSSSSCHSLNTKKTLSRKTALWNLSVHQRRNRKREMRGRKSNSYGSNLMSCQETRQGSIHQWQTRHDWGTRLSRLPLLIMCVITRPKYTNVSHVQSGVGFKIWMKDCSKNHLQDLNTKKHLFMNYLVWPFLSNSGFFLFHSINQTKNMWIGDTS